MERTKKASVFTREESVVRMVLLISHALTCAKRELSSFDATLGAVPCHNAKLNLTFGTIELLSATLRSRFDEPDIRLCV